MIKLFMKGGGMKLKLLMAMSLLLFGAVSYASEGIARLTDEELMSVFTEYYQNELVKGVEESSMSMNDWIVREELALLGDQKTLVVDSLTTYFALLVVEQRHAAKNKAVKNVKRVKIDPTGIWYRLGSLLSVQSTESFMSEDEVVALRFDIQQELSKDWSKHHENYNGLFNRLFPDVQISEGSSGSDIKNICNQMKKRRDRTRLVLYNGVDEEVRSSCSEMNESLVHQRKVDAYQCQVERGKKVAAIAGATAAAAVVATWYLNRK